VYFLLKPAHYGLCSQHLLTVLSASVDCAVSICGLSAQTSTLWTVLSAFVDFLLKPARYGLCCQHLWTVLTASVDCNVHVCGLSAQTSTSQTVLSAFVDFLLKPAHYGLCCQQLWTLLSASVDSLLQPGHYILSYMIQAAKFGSQLQNRQTNKQSFLLP
jgi:hypothetical protein